MVQTSYQNRDDKRSRDRLVIWEDVQNGHDGKTFFGIDGYPKNYKLKVRNRKFRHIIKKYGQCPQVGLPCTKVWHRFKLYKTSCVFRL